MIRTTAASALIAFVTLAGTPAWASATDDVRAAMLKLAGLSSYEMSFAMGPHGGTADFVKPNSIHMVGSGFEMIRIGSTIYMRQGSRGWMKMRDTHGAGPFEIANRIREAADRVNQLSATDLGMKNVDGERLHAYRVTSKDGSSTVFIGGDGLPHRFDSGGEGHNVVRISKFNAIAPIRPPV